MSLRCEEFGAKRLQMGFWQRPLPVPIGLNELLHELPQVQ